MTDYSYLLFKKTCKKQYYLLFSLDKNHYFNLNQFKELISHILLNHKGNYNA